MGLQRVRHSELMHTHTDTHTHTHRHIDTHVRAHTHTQRLRQNYGDRKKISSFKSWGQDRVREG